MTKDAAIWWQAFGNFSVDTWIPETRLGPEAPRNPSYIFHKEFKSRCLANT